MIKILKFVLKSFFIFVKFWKTLKSVILKIKYANFFYSVHKENMFTKDGREAPWISSLLKINGIYSYSLNFSSVQDGEIDAEVTYTYAGLPSGVATTSLAEINKQVTWQIKLLVLAILHTEFKQKESLLTQSMIVNFWTIRTFLKMYIRTAHRFNNGGIPFQNN